MINEERIHRLKKFKESYILLLCFIFAIQLVITKIKAMMGSIWSTVIIAFLLITPVFLMNLFIRIEESKLKKQTPYHKKQPHEIFCPECGKPIPKDAKFCPECGEKIV